MKKLPGIFNDVIGPVMRGPSSSHTAASWRMARLCLSLVKGPLKRATIEFDQAGAWAPNYEEQGTVLGMSGGLLGLEITDDRIKHIDKAVEESGIEIHYRVSSFPADHPNTVRMTLESETGKQIQVIAVSTGGGSFEVRDIDGLPVTLSGDTHEMLVWAKQGKSPASQIANTLPRYLEITETENHESILVNVKSSMPYSKNLLEKISAIPEVLNLVLLEPVLPVVTGNGRTLPFTNMDEMLAYAAEKMLDAAQLGMLYEACWSGLTDQELKTKMEHLVGIIEKSIDTGLKGTDGKNRILPQQSHLPEQAVKEGKLPDQTFINDIISRVSAIMESKSALEVIVANPTAGSCGTVGGVLSAVSRSIDAPEEALTDAYFAAGLVGAWFAMGPGFSAEAHGCQVECGAASGMAAAGIVQLYGGTARQALDAASMAIQNMIGLVCDPVADRVEVPCLGKNISAAVNALTSATMARAGFDAVIPLQEVIDTIPQVSSHMPSCLKCTGRGGLALTNTARRLKQAMEGEQSGPPRNTGLIPGR